MFTSSLLNYLCLNAVINLSAIGISNQIRKKSEQQQSEFEKYCDDMLKREAEETMKRYKETYAKSEAKDESETILKENAIVKTRSNNKKTTKKFELTETVKNEIIEKVNDAIQLPKFNDFDSWLYDTSDETMYVRGTINAPTNTSKVFVTENGFVCLDKNDKILFGNESTIITYCGLTGIKFNGHDYNIYSSDESKLNKNAPAFLNNSHYYFNNMETATPQIRPYSTYAVPHLEKAASCVNILISKNIDKSYMSYIGIRSSNNLAAIPLNDKYIIHDVNNDAIFGMDSTAFIDYKKICDILPDTKIGGFCQFSNQVISSCMYHEYSGNSIIRFKDSELYANAIDNINKVIEWCCTYYIETGDEITNEIIIQAKNSSRTAANKN